MGFQKPLDPASIMADIRRTGGEINSRYNDGYTSWALKQDLYLIKFLLDDVLNNSCKFSDEEKWLEEQDKKKMWKELKK